jgi:hypothetical protein
MLICIVHYYVSGYPVSTDYVLPEEFFDCGGANISKRLCFYPFCEIFHCEGIIALCSNQLSYNVDAPSLQRPQWSY